MGKYVGDLMGFVESTRNRSVVVFRRSYGDRTFIRMRVFNRHKERGFWYPSPRSFHVHQTCARQVGEAIICAADGVDYCQPPEWWAEFEAQYEPTGKHVAKWKREPVTQ